MLYNEYLTKKRPYQKYGHLLLLKQKHACLFFKPGKGKSFPCIDAIRDVYKEKNGKCKVLIMSTADSVRKMWETEIVPQKVLPPDTTIVTFNKAIQDSTMPMLLRTKWDVIVVDECHRIKARASKISKLVYGLSKRAEYVWGLSGTPRGNTDVDIFCQFHNMHIAGMGQLSYTKFIETYCEYDRKYYNGQMIKIPTGIRQEYQQEWNNMVAEYSVREDYTDEDNMPDLTVNTIRFDYKPTKEYKDALNGVIQIPDYETTMTKLVAIQKLHQIVNGYEYYVDDNDKRLVHRINENVKLDWLVKQNLDKALVVYRFEEDYKRIAECFEKAGITYTDDIAKFKETSTQVLILQCSRCESFNLQSVCKRAIFYTLDYSYIKYNQMMHRIWRMGQTEQVQIDVLIFRNTIEEKIWRTVQNKEKLANLFMAIKGE